MSVTRNLLARVASGVKVHELSTEGWRLCGESRAGLFTRCYSGHSLALSDTQPGDATIRAWLDRAREYPTASGVLGWVADRDGLIALLSECYVRGVPASVIPHAVDEDVVTFSVQFSVSFARSELTDPTVNAEEQP